MNHKAEKPRTAEISADNLRKGDTILWEGKRQKVTLVSLTAHGDVWFEMGPLSDVIVRPWHTITYFLPEGYNEGEITITDAEVEDASEKFAASIPVTERESRLAQNAFLAGVEWRERAAKGSRL